MSPFTIIWPSSCKMVRFLPTAREAEAALTQCLQRLERRHLQELQESLLASEDASVPPPREIESAVADVNARLKELYSQPLQ